MALPLHTLDVFTDRRFCGNPLAVVGDADALDSAQMQAIARELNLAETVFVLKPQNPAHSARVRIFTPGSELPFAGHPTIGTAILLAELRTPLVNGERDALIVLEQTIGTVRVGVRLRPGQPPFAEFDAPKLPEKATPPPARDRIADALALAERFAQGDSICVILGDNIIERSIRDAVDAFRKQEKGARILLKEVHDAERFGVAEIVGDRIAGIEEKPANPKSNYAVTGIYMYDSSVFSKIHTLVPSNRGELEITDVNNGYIQEGTMQFSYLDGWWTDAGTFESLLRAANLVASKVQKENEQGQLQAASAK